MSPSLRILLPAVLLALLPFQAGAAEVENLFDTVVAVEDQSTESRGEALEEALQEIIVRITGRTAVLESPTARELLRRPARYLQQYRYGSESTSEGTQLVLHATFDGAALERRLRASGLPIWGRERPGTLVLMAVDAPNGGRNVVRAAGDLGDAWRAAAKRRGLPLSLPAMDSEDRGRIAAMDIWGVFEDPLLAAADRYDPNAVLVVSSWPSGGNDWAMRATLLREGERNLRWESQAGSLYGVVNAAVDQLAEAYAEEFAVGVSQFPLGGRALQMEVRNVGKLDSYARLLDYLGGLSVVESVGVERVEPDRVHLRIELRGSRDALEKAIALGRWLEPVTSTEMSISLGQADNMDFTAPQALIYRYRR